MVLPSSLFYERSDCEFDRIVVAAYNRLFDPQEEVAPLAGIRHPLKITLTGSKGQTVLQYVRLG